MALHTFEDNQNDAGACDKFKKNPVFNVCVCVSNISRSKQKGERQRKSEKKA